MKIKIKKTIETEIELQLPAFFNHDECEIKIISETELIDVRPKIEGSDWCYVYNEKGMFVPAKINNVVANGTLSTEENFISAMMGVAHHINKLIQENVPVTVNQDL